MFVGILSGGVIREDIKRSDKGGYYRSDKGGY